MRLVLSSDLGGGGRGGVAELWCVGNDEGAGLVVSAPGVSAWVSPVRFAEQVMPAIAGLDEMPGLVATLRSAGLRHLFVDRFLAFLGAAGWVVFEPAAAGKR